MKRTAKTMERSLPRRTAQLATAVTLIAIATLGLHSRASAHASFVSSSPSDKQVLTTAPAAVSITFAENLAPAPGSFITVSTGGESAASADSSISTSDTKTMSIALKSDSGNGKYNVFWKSTSADDGGVTFGSFLFLVGQPTAADLANTPGGASVAVPDEATDMAQTAGGTTTVKLAAGCNMVALTFP